MTNPTPQQQAPRLTIKVQYSHPKAQTRVFHPTQWEQDSNNLVMLCGAEVVRIPLSQIALYTTNEVELHAYEQAQRQKPTHATLVEDAIKEAQRQKEEPTDHDHNP